MHSASANFLTRAVYHACLVLLIILGFAKHACARHRHISIADSLHTYHIDLRGIRASSLKAFLRNGAQPDYGCALADFFDSLGFFSPAWDTLDGDTIRIAGLSRTSVDTVSIECSYGFSIDSIAPFRFPRPYNAGEIAALAKRAVEFLGRRGYPYATLAIELDSARGSAGVGTVPASMKIRFKIEAGERYALDRALFAGEYKTRDRILARDIVFRRGDIFDLRFIEASQKRLMSRSYIVSARAGAPGIVPAPTDTFSSVSDSAQAAIPKRYVAVPFLIRDNSGMGLDGALTFQSDDGTDKGVLAGYLDLTLLNIFRTGESGSVYYRGEKGLQQFDLSISRPHLLKLPLVGSAGFGLEIQEATYGYLHAETEFLIEFETLWQTGIALRGHETTLELPDGSQSWRFAGADLVLKRNPERYQARVFSRFIDIRTGTGVADRDEGRFQRWRAEISAGTHIPFLRRHAIANSVTGKAIVTDDRDSLHAVERFRTGGHSSVRGYSENEFAFRTVAYIKNEYLFYINDYGSVYIFLDGGVGFTGELDISRSFRTDMLGYGIGIRIPVKIGSASLAWARNYKERRGFGRIHVRIQNAVASGKGWNK